MKIKNYSTKFFSNNEILNSYLRDIRKYKLLTVDEEKELMKKYKSEGDIIARDQLIMCNQRFLYAIAKIYARNEDEVMDFVNEGNRGLLEAIERFDINNESSNKLITFAVWYIRREMNSYLNTTSNIIVKSNTMKIGKKAERIRQKYYAENGYYASDEIVIELLEKEYGLVIKDSSDVMDVNVNSINEEVSDDYTVYDTSDFAEKTSSVNSYENETDDTYNKQIIGDILSSLDEKKADIVKMLFGIGYDRAYTSSEIADKYDYDVFTFNSIKNNIMKFLKQNRGKYNLAV